jgi:hypothetical protein
VIWRLILPQPAQTSPVALPEGGMLAIARSVTLTPRPLHHTPERYVRPDGSSRLHAESRIVYTTEALLGAEARLLEAARKSRVV